MKDFVQIKWSRKDSGRGAGRGAWLEAWLAWAPWGGFQGGEIPRGNSAFVLKPAWL